MTICGLKLTHDGSIAVIRNNKLIFSIELEKIRNNARYTGIEDLGIIPHILQQEGCPVGEIDRFVIDGWGGYDEEALAVQPRLTIGKNFNILACENGKKPLQLGIAQYQERDVDHSVLDGLSFTGLKMGAHDLPYSGYLHVTGHILSAYCTSSFAASGQSSYVLVWDGGMYPRLYFVDALNHRIDNLGPLFFLVGNVYTIFSQHFGPFKVPGSFAKDDLSVAGKVMAYIAYGQLKEELLQMFDGIFEKNYDKPMGFANVWANELKKRIAGRGFRDEDVLASFHIYLERMLRSKLEKKITRFSRGCRNICIAGGCGLNIKWNSAIRSMSLFDKVYVPPFPNDSGSAIGMACAEMIRTGNWALDWNVYSGPSIMRGDIPAAYSETQCTVADLARLLYETGEPVAFLHGRAELGPRALGNRSLLAAPGSSAMKDILNFVKERETYRPVSPICLEDKASAIFDPGTPDPFMLFDHLVRPEWLGRIPAICHLDGTARLQTVNERQNPLIFALLKEYEKLSGLPLLCNTSANLKGSGFFPDIASAAAWDRVNYIWSGNVLYQRTEKIVFDQSPVAAELRLESRLQTEK